MSQSQIAANLSRIPTTNIWDTAECRDNVLRIICHNFFAPCGRNGTIYPPTSICREECSYVRDTCQIFWEQAFQAIESELERVNCESPGSALSPLPTCCTGAGVSIPTTSAGVNILIMTTSELYIYMAAVLIGGLALSTWCIRGANNILPHLEWNFCLPTSPPFTSYTTLTSHSDYRRACLLMWTSYTLTYTIIVMFTECVVVLWANVCTGVCR